MAEPKVTVQRSEVGGGPRGTVPGGPAVAGAPPATVSGVQLMQGVGVQPAKGFWADAWSTVSKRWTARLALSWLSVVLFFAVFAPVLASGHPLVFRQRGAEGVVTSYPLLERLSGVDVLLLIAGVAGPLWFLLARALSRGQRLWALIVTMIQCGVVAIGSGAVFGAMRGGDNAEARRLVSSADEVFAGLESGWLARFGIALCFAALAGALAWAVLPFKSARARVAAVAAAGIVASAVCATWWFRPPETFPYAGEVEAGRAEAVYTAVPFSPSQRSVTADLLPPGASRDQTRERPGPPTPGQPVHALGTDSFGQDVLSQMMHASRLAISIGLVSTTIAVVIGVTIGALMGYFGGWVDLLLYRVVEVFMSVPVLFLLIVAAAVLPRNTYVMMAIIGCVTWTGAARFTRAEFMRLRNMDFVQGAKAAGLPLRSILFRHMLPNGVTPVLVDASFAIAAAILAEATLSYLGLGPEEQPSWGRLLSESTSNVGEFLWWLAIFPGLAIFLSVLAYNLLGEALRDAIDPKLKKARV